MGRRGPRSHGGGFLPAANRLVCSLVVAAALAGIGGAVPAVGYAATFFVAPPGLTRCAYDGAREIDCQPSDVNACATPASPCATLARVASLLSQSGLLTTVATIQLADTPPDTCYRPNGVVLGNVVVRPGAQEGFWDVARGTGTAAYPPAYIYLRGNTLHPARVVLNGSGSCAGRPARETPEGVKFVGTVARVRGMTFRYFGNGTVAQADSGAVECLTSTCYLEDLAVKSNNVGALVTAWNQAHVKMGGTFSVIDATAMNVLALSLGDFMTPLTRANTTFAVSESGTLPVFFANTMSKLLLDHVDATFQGRGAYTIFAAMEASNVYFNDAFGRGGTRLIFDAPNATELGAEQGATIFEGCGSYSATCTFRALRRRAHASVLSGIAYNGRGGGSQPDLAESGSRICNGAFPGTCN